MATDAVFTQSVEAMFVSQKHTIKGRGGGKKKKHCDTRCELSTRLFSVFSSTKTDASGCEDAAGARRCSLNHPNTDESAARLAYVSVLDVCVCVCVCGVCACVFLSCTSRNQHVYHVCIMCAVAVATWLMLGPAGTTLPSNS